MKNGNVSEFIDQTTYEECAVMYMGAKYFFHGVIYDKEANEYSYDIDIWDDHGNYVRTIFSKKASSPEKCLELAQNEPIFEGKTFWEAEQDMEWVEW